MINSGMKFLSGIPGETPRKISSNTLKEIPQEPSGNIPSETSVEIQGETLSSRKFIDEHTGETSQNKSGGVTA